MAVGYVGIASGESVSSAYVLPTPCRAIAIGGCSSLTGTQVNVQFATAATGPFVTLTRNDGTGYPYAIYSGAVSFWGTIEFPPTNVLRLSTVASQASANSFAVIALKFT